MRHIAKLTRLAHVLIFLVALTASSALGQDAVVTRNVYLRPAPSTANTPIRKLLPPDEVDLIDATPSEGFYHVRTLEGDEEGWVWGRNIRITTVEGTDATGGGILAFNASPLAAAFSESWGKPNVVTGSFKSGAKTCGPTGSAPGNETNRRKNRVDVPSSYHAVSFSAFFALPDLHVPKDRATWQDSDREEIAKFEGVPISLTGYLVAIKPQDSGSGETTNCKWTKYKETDWHMALVEDAGQGERLSVVVETTPRIRVKHQKWTETNLDPWLDEDTPVRISGWVLFDPEHRNHMGKYRKSMWEIHPITKIEVWKNDKWVDLDKF